jgi:hypothetical protein
MKIDGISQSTGVERLVEMSLVKQAVQLMFTDRVGGEPEIIEIPFAVLNSFLRIRTKGPQTINGTSGGEARQLKFEIRGNEVLLEVGQMDAAVGLSDLKDALLRFAT